MPQRHWNSIEGERAWLSALIAAMDDVADRMDSVADNAVAGSRTRGAGRLPCAVDPGLLSQLGRRLALQPLALAPQAVSGGIRRTDYRFRN